jgi:N-dimethylarginine dimethylaminohydrolase
VSTASNARVNGELERLGYCVIALDADQFIRCGGGIHCLTMPLSRLPG